MESTAQEQCMPDATTDTSTAETCELRMSDIMSRDVVTAAPGDTLFNTVKRMTESGISCVVVVEQEQVAGILCEKDILREVSGAEVNFHRLTVAQGMSSPVHTAAPETTVLAASRLMRARQIKRLPILDDDRLVGIVTQTDITRGLVTLSPLKSIADIMTRNITTIPVDATIAEAAREMTFRGISCIVATHRGEPTGIITKKDLIRRVAALQKDPADSRVADVMSFPIIAIPASYSILSAGRKMDSMHLHRLIVMEDKKVCGIVTQTDIMTAIRRELERLESEHCEWKTGLATLVQNTIEDLRRLQGILEKLDGSSATPPESTQTRHVFQEGRSDN